MDTELSSVERSQDWWVTLEAMSLGDAQAGGAGLQIRYGIHETPFGWGLLATTDRGICALHFLDSSEPSQAVNILRQTWSHAELLEDLHETQPLCDRIFHPDLSSPGSGNHQSLRLLVKGSHFQLQVWRALLRIPFGAIMTYQTIAQQIDRPTAARAVGTAIGQNAIGYLIPCHRVIRESGALGGYRWGLDRKSAILAWEARDPDAVARKLTAAP